MKDKTKETLDSLGCIIPTLVFIVWMVASDIKGTVETVVAIGVTIISFFLIVWPIRFLIDYINDKTSDKYYVHSQLTAFLIAGIVIIVLTFATDLNTKLFDIIINFIF